MATIGQKIHYVERENLKEKYRNRADRIKSMCKAISQTVHTKIYATVNPNGTVRFEFVGTRIKRAQQYVEDEFCSFKSHAAKGSSRIQPSNLSQEALKVLPEQDQEKLLREGKPFLLTEEALRKHDISTGVLQLREFACASCDRVWWKTTPCTKPVSKCFICKTKYDALPREKEFGIGRYRCLECNNSFFARCEATTIRPCFNCDFVVRAPYIHPKFKPVKRNRPPVDPSMSLFIPPKYPKKRLYLMRDPSRGHSEPVLIYIPLQTKPRHKVINASKMHDSTGSTASTFITQIEFPASVYEEGTEDTVGVVISDPESDDEDVIVCSSSSDSDSDGQSPPPEPESEYCTDQDIARSTSGAMYGSGSDSSSDSDNSDKKAPRKRSAASSGSESSSDSDSDSKDADKKTSKAPPSKTSSTGSSDKGSINTSTKDSGLGTAGSSDLGSSTATKSTGSYQGSVPLASVAAFNPTDFPGIVFSKKCAEKEVDHRGAQVIGEGIKLRVPENALQSGDSVKIELQGCIKGPFVLPRDTVLVSPVYRVAPPFVFHEEVILTIEHFAVLESDEDCDEMVFITSPTKPKIREKTGEAYWKFQVYAKPECVVRSRHGDVHLRHFCLGALGRRSRRGQKYRYCASLYSPLNFTPPRCNAIFSVALHHEVYIGNLERYLEKTFKDQHFLPETTLIRSTEDNIELQIPTNIEGYKVTTNIGCKIQKDQVDYPLKFKRRARSEISAYPPRVILNIHQIESNAGVSLHCRINVCGIREFPFFELNVVPPSASEVSSQKSIEGLEQDELQLENLSEITTYLKSLDNDHCISLGGEFGLLYTNLKRMSRHPEDVVAAWLRKEDKVSNRCPPTWRNLADALETIGQNGIANSVRRDHLQ